MDDGEAVVEVRFRGRDNFGGAAVSVDTTKQRPLNRAAQDYLTRNGLSTRPARFDVAAVGSDEQIDWIKGAFDAA